MKKQTSQEGPVIKHRIQRVPPWVREIEAHKKCFDPVVASIGPYHYGNPKFEMAEEFKAKSENRFISNCNPPRDISQIYSKVEAVGAEARNCYARDSTSKFNDEEFTRIMCRDGCFVLDLIYCIMEGKHNEHELMAWDHTLTFLMRDLFLLENQLPYVVLKELMSLRNDGDEIKNLVNEFVNNRIDPFKDYEEELSNATYEEEPSHLLHLLRSKLLGINRLTSSRGQVEVPMDSGDCVPLRQGRISSESQSNDGNWPPYPSIKELKTRGIKFKKSRTCFLKDINFKSHGIYADLSLPRIIIDDCTKDTFLNLIGYEKCSGVGSTVSSYICLLDTLIHHADDVKELRSKNIIFNALGSDEEAAKLVNEFAIGLHMIPGIYNDTIKGIHKHCQNKVWSHIGEFLDTHFSSPWTAIAFFAATYVIILTTIQTIFTVVDEVK